jgi:putative transposase
VKRPSIYLKMQVLGAIDAVPGKTRHERVRNAAALIFHDEEGKPQQFTWRTIQTWYYRYKNHGVTSMDTSVRADKGKSRKVTPEEVLEAINQALPHFRQKNQGQTAPFNVTAIYRFCIEKGLFRADQIARTTFGRFIQKYEMLKDDPGENKRRLAFSMQHANQLWQADTMFGPHVGGRQTTYKRGQVQFNGTLVDRDCEAWIPSQVSLRFGRSSQCCRTANPEPHYASTP